jgi:hypothetical protein
LRPTTNRIPHRTTRAVILLCLACIAAICGDAAPQDIGSGAAPSDPPPIADNSFLIEEAYNQEAGVIQHISLLSYLWGDNLGNYTFTQEWPFPRWERNQFSYSIPVVRANGTGIGDFALNYRYQMVGSGAARTAFAPRLSLLVPSGDSDAGRGLGGTSIQANLPLSIAVNPKLVMHFNAGATLTPRARNSAGGATLVGYNIGHSGIWRASPRVNFLLETVFSSGAEIVAEGKSRTTRGLLFVPGLRWAYNLRGGMQIVPGAGFAVGAGPSRGTRGLLLYLSIEHPLW